MFKFSEQIYSFLPYERCTSEEQGKIFMKIDGPFINEIFGLGMSKVLDLKNGFTNTIAVKFIRYTRFPDVTNNSSQLLTLSNGEALGIVDLRSFGYIKVKKSTI